jgi:glycosyltransferase involved in cell wall biosynthesis
MYFSIIIPTYNRATIIAKAINTVLAQSFTNFELLIVDDGSTDGTQQVIEQYKHTSIRYFKTENKGVAHARNYGIKQAQGVYIGFLDSDDRMNTNHLQTAHNFTHAQQQPAVAHLNFNWGEEDKSNSLKNILPKHLPNDLFNRCSLHVNCIFIKNTIAKQHLFNESKALMFAEDWDFFIKLSVRFPIQLLDDCTTYLIDHQDRSMRNFDEDKWILKRNAIAQSLQADAVIKERYMYQTKSVVAHMNSLIALNFSVRGYKLKTFSYWLLSVLQKPRDVFTRRTLAIIKHLLFTWK